MLGGDGLIPGGGQRRGGLLGLHVEVAAALPGRAAGNRGDVGQGQPGSGAQGRGRRAGSGRQADQEIGWVASAAMVAGELEGAPDGLQVRAAGLLVAAMPTC